MDNPYAAHLAEAQAKLEREQETEVRLSLKGKHLGRLRSLLFTEMQHLKAENPAEYELLLEIDKRLHAALQLV